MISLHLSRNDFLVRWKDYPKKCIAIKHLRDSETSLPVPHSAFKCIFKLQIVEKNYKNETLIFEMRNFINRYLENTKLEL